MTYYSTGSVETEMWLKDTAEPRETGEKGNRERRADIEREIERDRE